MPRGANLIKVRTVELEEDHENIDLLTRIVYSPEELGTLARHADDIELLLLLVGVNCAFGAAEIGRLVSGDVLLNHRHEYAERLQFKSSEADSFVRLIRPESKMFGDTLRHRGEDTLASICLAHKTSYKADNLLEAYGNKPFGRMERFRPKPIHVKAKTADRRTSVLSSLRAWLQARQFALQLCMTLREL